jgi:DNA-binding SARP family transcriptional activator
MEFRVLGPLELLGPSGVINVPGGRLRLLLAVLLLHPNEAVSADGLAEALFGTEAGASAVGTVRVHVSRLRRALGDEADRLVTSAAGYELRVGAGELDSERLGELVETGRNLLASDPERAAAVLRDALGLWRGRPLADLEFEASLQPAIARLEEQRLAALELRIDADLASGRADEVLPELHDLVQRHPLRERFHAQLMLALYRGGRQADALEVHRRLRATVVDELGIEPSNELGELQCAILRHDPSLGSSPPRRAPRSFRESARHPSRRVLALMALGTVAGVVAGMIALDDAKSPNTGSASALGTPSAFQARVVEVCEGVNASFGASKHEASVLRRRLDRAKTTMGQRDAILEATTAAVDRGGHNLANLRSLEPPANRQALLAETARLWEGNVEHLREYALRLDRVVSRRALLKAIEPLTEARPAMERDFVGVKAGLQRLGGPDCEIDLYIAKPIPLPELPDPKAPSRPNVAAKSGGASGASRPNTTSPSTVATPKPPVKRSNVSPPTSSGGSNVGPDSGVSGGGEG